MAMLRSLAFVFALALNGPPPQLPQPQAQVITESPCICKPQAKCEPCPAKAEEGYWSKAFKPDIFPVWIGGLAALLASIAGLITLGRLKKQSRIGLLAAEAAKLAAEVAVNSERAWMLIEGDPNPGFDSWIFNFSSKNYGKSPAEILFTDLSFGVLNIGDDLPEEPSYTKAKDAFSNREWVPPQGDTDVGSFHSYGVFTGDMKDEFDRIKEGRKILWLYGVVRYRDTVSATIHETRFCYWRKVGTGLIMGGPPGYNQCT